MNLTSIDHVCFKISAYSVIISRHVVENLFAMLEELVMVKLVWISLEMWTTEFVGLVLLKHVAGSNLVLECEPVPFVRLVRVRNREPAGKMPCHSVSSRLTRDSICRNRLPFLSVIASPESVVLEKGTRSVNFFSCNTLAGKHPLAPRCNLVDRSAG